MIQLGFYQHTRQNYYPVVPVDGLNEDNFNIGAFDRNGGVLDGGEFRVTLIRFQSRTHADTLTPQLHVFGDGLGSFYCAAELGLLHLVERDDWATANDFALELRRIGIEDLSDKGIPA